VDAKTFLVVVALGAIACGHAEPPAASPAPASSASNDANRLLTEEECQSLGQELAEKCHNRATSRVERVEGWCAELQRGVISGSWVEHNCLEHLHYMDSECMRSASSVGGMMDCESASQ
jgi:hypothetical protein